MKSRGKKNKSIYPCVFWYFLFTLLYVFSAICFKERFMNSVLLALLSDSFSLDSATGVKRNLTSSSSFSLALGAATLAGTVSLPVFSTPGSLFHSSGYHWLWEHSSIYLQLSWGGKTSFCWSSLGISTSLVSSLHSTHTFLKSCFILVSSAESCGVKFCLQPAC